MKRAVLMLSMAVAACGAPSSSSQDAGLTDAGTAVTDGGNGASSGFAGDECGNQVVVALTSVPNGFTGSSISDVSLATPSVTPSCGPRSKDVVFKIVAPMAGSLHVTVTPHGTDAYVHFDPVISIFTGATCAVATSASCGDTGGIDSSETLIQQVPAGPVWIWVSDADVTDTGSEFSVSVLLD